MKPGLPPLPHEPRLVKQELQSRIEELLPRLGVLERPRGSVLVTSNPRRADSKKGQFAIWIGRSAGAFVDYGGTAKGDIWGLIEYLAGLQGWIDAYWWALDFLGWAKGTVRSAEQAKLDRQEADDRARARELKDQAKAREFSHRLFQHWMTLPAITGTVAEVYLREARGIPMERLGSAKYRLGALRFAERLEHVDDGPGGTGEVTIWPAMVAAVTNGKTVTGLHRTWLDPEGRGKAEVRKPKKMIGTTRGGAIRLTPGPSGLSPTLAAKRAISGTLAIGEGIETSLSVAAAMPAWRVWAAGSLVHMGLLAWPECASRVILLKDRDWAPTAQLAFERVVMRWREQARGRAVEVATSDEGSDFNDWLKGGAA
jgi:hypothetical protein